MNRMKSILALVLVIALTACLFTGCETESQKIEKLAGTWSLIGDNSSDKALNLLESADFYEEEIALADLDSLKYVQTVTFKADKTYSFSFDAEATRQCVKDYLTSVFDAMFEKRSTLSELYETDLGAMTKEEFRAFYAELYVVEDFDALLDMMADICHDYEELAEPWETGTYSIKGSDIMCTITGETQAEALGYKIEEDQLTLIYADLVEVYTR